MPLPNEVIQQSNIALYTTVYPGALIYLPEWVQSVRAQTDMDFDLWVGLDDVGACHIAPLFGQFKKPNFQINNNRENPIYLRRKILLNICQYYEAVILVDSDDLLMPDRVKMAKSMLQNHDVVGCAMQLMDVEGRSLSSVFTDEVDVEYALIRTNRYGLSNTAYRCLALRSLLLNLPECRLLDWMLITFAWLQGVAIGFDTRCQMVYRIYPENMAQLVPPFKGEYLLKAAGWVVDHYESVFTRIDRTDGLLTEKITLLSHCLNRAKHFLMAYNGDTTMQEDYIHALNGQGIQPAWWNMIANSDLERLWKR